MQIVTGTQMKKIDQLTTRICGIDSLSLMETAGRIVFEEIIRETKANESPLIVLICGPGNNGGDGYVAACLLLSAGISCSVYSTVDTSGLTGDAKINYEKYREIGGTVSALSNESEDHELFALEILYQQFADSLDKCDLIVDAILGTGVSRTVTGTTAEVIERINTGGCRVLSVDIPSGIGGEDGLVYGAAVRASKTITFQLPKLGCVIYPGADYCGDLIIRKIGIPEELISEISEGWDATYDMERTEETYMLAEAAGSHQKNRSAKMHLMDRSYIETLIKARRQDSHKGNYGKVLILAGSTGMAGAAALCARAALRSGTGLVKVAVTPEIIDIIQMLVPEAICVFRRDLYDILNEKDLQSSLDEDRRDAAMDYDAIVIGPGLGRDPFDKTLVKHLLQLETIVVLDADGLNILSDDPDLIKNTKAKLILTPHPGEAARLLSCSTQDINSRRIDSAKKLSQKTEAIVVLKGAASIVALPEGPVYINTTGNPGMATAGSGDVLAGAIAAFAAQGLTPEHAAQAGVYLHGLAGDIMAEQIGEYGLIASDLAVGMGMAIHAVAGHKN